MIGKVIAFFGMLRNPCPSGLFFSHTIENCWMKCKAASFYSDVFVGPS